MRPPTASERSAIADAVADLVAQGPVVAAHAIVSDSAIARGVMTAISWVSPHPFPEAAFSTPRAAVDWAKKHSPSLDVDAVEAALLRVPEIAALTW